MFLKISKFLESSREALSTTSSPMKRMSSSPTDLIVARLSLHSIQSNPWRDLWIPVCGANRQGVNFFFKLSSDRVGSFDK